MQHKDRSLGGREIANSPAFLVPRVGDRMSFMPSDVPADPNPFAEGAVVLETVPDFRVRFSGTIVHQERDRFVLRADFQTAAGPQESGDLFECIFRDDSVKNAVLAGHTRVTFVRCCRPSRGSIPLADDVTLDIPLMGVGTRQQSSYQQVPQPHHQPYAGISVGGPSFAFTSDATFRGRPAVATTAINGGAPSSPGGGQDLSASAQSVPDARAQRGSARFQTWPVVYFEGGAAGQQAGKSDAESSASTSGESTPRKKEPDAVAEPPREVRTPLKVNLNKPIVEFAFRPALSASSIPVMNPASAPLPLPQSDQSVAPLQQPVPQPAVPRVTPASLVPAKREFTVTLTTHNDAAEMRTLLSPLVLALVEEKLPKFAETLVSVAMDVGALPVLSFNDGSVIRGEHLVTPEEVKQVVSGAGNLGPEGSSVVRHSLHLCSTIVHPISRDLMGYTLKVGRSVVGLADVFDKVIGPQTSVLVLGEFCTGKTVLLRDLARRAAGDVTGKLVAVVDTTGELGGAADGKSHVGLGLSRCVRCLRKGQLHEAVDSTVGKHGIASVVVDNVVTSETVSALLSKRN